MYREKHMKTPVVLINRHAQTNKFILGSKSHATFEFAVHSVINESAEKDLKRFYQYLAYFKDVTENEETLITLLKI